MENLDTEKKEYKPTKTTENENTFHLVDRGDGWKELSMDMPNSSANIFTKEVLEEFSVIVGKLEKEVGLKGLLITSAKPSIFIAGADINLIKSLHSFNDAQKVAREGRDLIHRFSKLPFETVAAVNGACLGGGMEFILGCTKRIVSTSSKVKLGLPEVKLGILPGLGGCVRLPRITNIPTAIDLIVSGKNIDGKKALKTSIATAFLPQENFHERALKWAKDNCGKKPKKAKKTVVDYLFRIPFMRKLLFNSIRKNVMKKTKGFYPAPLKILEFLEGSIGKKNMEAILEEEGKSFASLAVTPVSKYLISIFQASENARKSDGIDGVQAKVTVERAAVLGAGIMGGGIAHAFSKVGLPIRMKDISLQALALGYKQVASVFQKSVRRRRLKKQQIPRKMGLVTSTLDYSGFRSVDLVIEAIVEDMEIKKKVLQETEKHIREDCILVSNTSSLSITEMQSVLAHPERMGGLHFFSPVDRMPLVEVIAGKGTSAETINTLYASAKKLGKTPVIVKDCPGFLVNRLLLPYLNEAVFLLEEKVPIERIDQAMLNFGMPMGPLRLADEVGLDTAAKVGSVLHKAYGDRAQTSPLLGKLVSQGYLGKKNKKGFYQWNKNQKVPPSNADVYKMLDQSGNNKEDKSNTLTTYAEDQLVKRMLYPMINEAAIALKENVVRSAEELDLALIFGTGFPPHLGGLLHYADAKGIKTIVDQLQIMASIMGRNTQKDNTRLRPSPAISSLASSSKGFYQEYQR